MVQISAGTEETANNQDVRDRQNSSQVMVTSKMEIKRKITSCSTIKAQCSIAIKIAAMLFMLHKYDLCCLTFMYCVATYTYMHMEEGNMHMFACVCLP